MNNAQIIETLKEETEIDVKPHLREQETKLLEIIEALQNISSSNFWNVLLKEFNDDLRKLVSRLEKEKDTSEIFRIQGEIKGMRKLNLIKSLNEKRQELEMIRKKLL